MSLGVLYNGLYDANEFIAFARDAQALGVDSAWIAEQPGHRDAFAIATALVRQSRLKVYLGANSPYSEHPITIAMNAASLYANARGRAGLVLGTGGIPNRAAYGGLVEEPVPAIRETVAAIRGIRAGETVEIRGTRGRFRGLDRSAPSMPIFLAAISPKMQAAAGEVADGVAFSSGHSPAFLAHSRRRVLAAHAASDRAGQPFACAGFIVASVAADRAAAYDRTKALLSYLFSSPFKAEDWALNGVRVDHAAILRALQQGDAQGAKQLVSDELVELCSATGAPAEFQESIKAYAAVGLEQPVLAPLGAPEQKRQAVRLARDVFGPAA